MLAKTQGMSLYVRAIFCMYLSFVYSTVNISRRIQIKFLVGVLTD